MQPVICIIGQDLENIQEAYVVVDDQQYRVPNCLDAVALTFKIFYSLDCAYPKPCLRLWQFFQQAGYDLSLNEPNIKTVKELLGLTKLAFKEANLSSTLLDQQ